MNPADEKCIEELFELALDQAPENQAAFLDERCAGRPEVRAKVERLLRLDHAGLETGLHTPMYWSGDRAASGDEEPKPERIGRYEIVRKIGEGGMGTVYEATQDHPRRAVALKVIRPGGASRDMIRRFRHEADILGHLQHPGIAQVYEAGVSLRSDGDGAGSPGQPFFAMELIRGEPLLDYARHNNLRTHQRMELLAKICDAVEHAHQKGVIHRNLKPSNVLVTAEGQPKILDFGVARATDSDLQTATLQTAVGQLIGTVPYMSPEQVTGDSRNLDTRSDVYALGVILYELLGDQLPHDLRHCSIPEAARIIQQDEPSRLSSLNIAFRGDIETIVSKALDKDRERRYSGASALAADIRRYLHDEPVVARPASSMYQLRKFTKRHKGLVGGVIATVFTLVLGSTVAIVLALFALDQRDQAGLNAERATRIAYSASMAAAAVSLGNHDVVAAQRHLDEAPASLRGWEWQHFNSRLDDSTIVIRQHHHYALAFSADGSAIRAATKGEADDQYILKTWNAVDGTLRHTRVIDSPAQFGMGSGQDAIIFADQDHRLFTLDADSGVILGGFGGRTLHRQQSLYLQFRNLSRDGRRVALTDTKSEYALKLVLLEVGQRELRVLIENAVEPPKHVVLSADGTLLAYEIGAELWLWDADEGRLLWRTPPHGEAFSGIAISPDNTRVATAGSDGVLRIWDAATGHSADWKLAYGHADGLRAVAYNPSGTLIATAGQDRTIRLWDAATGRTVRVLHGHAARIKSLEFSPDGSRLASGSIYDHTIRVWDVSAESDARVLPHEMFVYPAAISPDGARIATGDWDGFVHLWDAASGAAIASLPSQSHYHSIVHDLAFSPDGSLLAAAHYNWDKYTPSGQGACWITVFDAATGEAVARITTSSHVHALAFDPRGGYLAGGILKHGVKLWALGSFDEVRHCGIAGTSLTYSPDGRVIAASGPDRSILFLNSDTLELLSRLPGHDAQVNGLAFNPDGSRLASASGDRTVRIWDVSDGTLLATLRGHSDSMFSADFSPDGSRLATGSNDRSIRIWDTATFDEDAQLMGHTDHVWSLDWSPDSHWLVSGSGDYTARIWETYPLSVRLASRDARRKMLLEIEPLVDHLYARLEDPVQVVQALRRNPSFVDRFREVAMQVALSEAVRRRKLTRVTEGG